MLFRSIAEGAAGQAGELQLPPPVPGSGPVPPAHAEAHVAVPASSPAKPVDAEASFRRARIGVVAVIALVLLLVWIMQRRAGNKQP